MEGYLRPSNRSFPTTLKVGSLELSNSQTISNAFNNYFSTIGTDLAKSIATVEI
jgi:hypothetical protein